MWNDCLHNQLVGYYYYLILDGIPKYWHKLKRTGPRIEHCGNEKSIRCLSESKLCTFMHACLSLRHDVINFNAVLEML